MATWTGLGMNYGHQTSSSSYSTTQVEADYAYLQSIGVTRLRIVFPQFDASSATINNCKDMVTRALNHGFYVVWGVVGGFGSNTLTATRWSSMKTYITGTLAPWAQSNGLSELCLGNENELATDGTTLTNSTMRADTRTMASTIKTNGYTGKVSYSTSVLSTYRNPWASEGIGSLDYIAFNSYDTLTNFNTNKPTIVSQFGSTAYISEFGSITNGQSDYASEQAYYTDVVGRINSMRNAGISYGYFFCFRDGSFGVPTNSFGLVQTKNTANWAHYALYAVSGTRLYAPRTFGAPVQFGTGINAPAAESLPLTESPSLQGSSSLASESVSISETTPSLTGLPSLTDNVSLNELNTSSNTIQSIDNVSPNELNTSSNTIQIDAELTSIAENTSLTGQVQNTDSVQVDDSNPSLQSRIVYALRAFGSPVKYSVGPNILVIPADSVSLSESIISRKKYALRAFGSPVQYGVVASTMNISETTPISETAALSSSTTLSAEPVSIAEQLSLTGLPLFSELVQVLETIAQTGQPQFIDNVQLLEQLGATRYAPRVFGAPAQYGVAGSVSAMSISESIGATESISLSATESIASEAVQILEALSAAGSSSSIDTVQASDTTSSQSSSTIAAEAISLSDILAQAGSSSLQAESVSISDTTSQSLSMVLSESAQISEQTTFAANTSFSEQTAISDVLALLGLSQFIENVLIGEDGVLQSAQSQFIENVQLLESTGVSGTSVIAGETALVSEQSNLTGLSQISEAGTQLSEALISLLGSLSNAIQIKKYAPRVFGAPVEYIIISSSTDTVSLVEMLSRAGAGIIDAEEVSLADTSTQAGLPTFIEAVSLSDALSSLINSSLIIEIAPISELASFAGSQQTTIDAIQISELLSLLGIDQFLENIILSELVSDVSFPSTNATFYVRKGNTIFYVRKGNATVTVRR